MSVHEEVTSWKCAEARGGDSPQLKVHWARSCSPLDEGLSRASRIKAAPRMVCLLLSGQPAGCDFSFQPSLDRNRILALADLGFINRARVVHLLGTPGTKKPSVGSIQYTWPPFWITRFGK